MKRDKIGRFARHQYTGETFTDFIFMTIALLGIFIVGTALLLTFRDLVG